MEIYQHLADWLLLAVSSYELNYRGFTDSIESQHHTDLSKISAAVLTSEGIVKSDAA